MKMGKKDPRSSMSKSVKGTPPTNKAGKNPFKSASPYETPGVGECSATAPCVALPPASMQSRSPKGPSLKDAPEQDPVADETGTDATED